MGDAGGAPISWPPGAADPDLLNPAGHPADGTLRALARLPPRRLRDGRRMAPGRLSLRTAGMAGDAALPRFPPERWFRLR
jgi:hypothetical protein